MEMNLNEVVNKLEELDKIKEALTEAVQTNKRCEINNKYANISIKILNNELENLKAKIQQFRNDAVVTYDNDMDCINKFLKVSNEEIAE